MNRRKFQIDMQKKQYQRHLRNLEFIEEDKKNIKKRIQKNKEIIDSLIQKSHKLHAKSNSHKFRILSLNSRQPMQSLQKKYSRIKSVVKTQMIKELPVIPSKQRNTEKQFYIEKQNICLFNRLMYVKPSIQFRQQKKSYKKYLATISLIQQNTKKGLHKKQNSAIFNTDFSSILNSSILGQTQKKKIIIKLHNKKNQECLKISFNKEQMRKIFRNIQCFQRSYFLQVQFNGKHRIKTQISDLQSLLSQQIHIFRYKNQEILLRFYEVYNEKEIYKCHFCIPINNQQKKSNQEIDFFFGSKVLSKIKINLSFHKIVKNRHHIIIPQQQNQKQS